jgi:hypothetical protein
MKSYGTTIQSSTKIDGTVVASGSASVSSIDTDWHTWITEALGSKTFNKAATAFTVSVVAAFDVYNNGAYMGGGSGSFSLTVPALANGSDFTMAASVNAGSSLALTINRTVSTYKHKVSVSFGSKSYSSGTTATIDTSLSVPIPIDWLTEIPAAASGVANVSVETYSGTTKIGSTVTKAVTIVASATAVPVIGTLTAAQIYDILSPAVPSTWNKYIKNRSGVRITAGSIVGYQGSTIVSTVISGGGFSVNGSMLETGVLNTAGAITFTATVTDSRGKTATKTVSITVTDYTPPSITSVLSQRCNSAGTLDSSGTYALGTAVFTYDTIGGSNSATRALSFKEISASSWSTAVSFNSGTAVKFGGSLDVTKTYDVRYIVTDFFSSVQMLDTVSISAPVVEFGNGGLTVAIGKEPEAGQLGVDVGWIARFRKAVTFDDANIYVKSGSASVLLEAYIKSLIASTCPLKVGDIHLSVSASNPGTYWAGTTWVAWGTGRMPVGRDTAQTEFDTVEETGGANTVTLTTEQMPSHSHNIVQAGYTGSGSADKLMYLSYPAGRTNWAGQLSNTGGGAAHNNLPPYIVCYMWKRTA